MILERKRTLAKANTFIKNANELPQEVKDDSIILIGPMGTGKSTIAKLLAEKIEGGSRIPLDSKGQLEELYKQKKLYRNFKNFEFVLTGTVLSTLNRPYVIDFGAGHSIYEDTEVRSKMQEICSNFKNIILLLPTKEKEANRKILLERRNIEEGSNKDKDNWHFISAPDNYELATNIIYEDGKTPEEIADEILQIVQMKKKEKVVDNDKQIPEDKVKTKIEFISDLSAKVKDESEIANEDKDKGRKKENMEFEKNDKFNPDNNEILL